MESTKALVYLRRSQNRDDKQTLSIEGQLKVTKNIVKTRNLSAEFLPAEERTAFSRGRPIFNEMMQKIHNGEAQAIVCWDIKRLSRNPYDSGEIIGAMSEGKLKYIYCYEKVWTNSADDMLMLSINLGFSKKDSDDISIGVKRGYMTKFERGEYPTYAPTGYLNARVNRMKNIIPDPNSADSVARIFKLAATGGYTIKDLVDIANDELNLRTRTGNEFSTSTMYYLLHNPVYYGVYKHSGEVIQGTFEPIISKDLFDKAHIALGWRNRKMTRNTTKGMYYPYKVMTCKFCGHNLTAYTKPKRMSDGSTRNYLYYRCTRKSKLVKCVEPQMNSGSLLEGILLHMDKITLTESEAKMAYGLLEKHYSEVNLERSNRKKFLENRSAENNKKLARILEMRIGGELTSDEYKRSKEPLLSEQVRTSQQIESVQNAADGWLEQARNVFSTAVNLKDKFAKATDHERRKIMLQIGSNWSLLSKEVYITPRKPFDSLYNRNINSMWYPEQGSNLRP